MSAVHKKSALFCHSSVSLNDATSSGACHKRFIAGHVISSSFIFNREGTH